MEEQLFRMRPKVLLTDITSLSQYKDLTHLRCKKFSCRACQVVCWSKEEIAAHVIKHHDNTCNLCGKRFIKSGYRLYKHWKSSHRNEQHPSAVNKVQSDNARRITQTYHVTADKVVENTEERDTAEMTVALSIEEPTLYKEKNNVEHDVDRCSGKESLNGDDLEKECAISTKEAESALNRLLLTKNGKRNCETVGSWSISTLAGKSSRKVDRDRQEQRAVVGSSKQTCPTTTKLSSPDLYFENDIPSLAVNPTQYKLVSPAAVAQSPAENTTRAELSNSTSDEAQTRRVTMQTEPLSTDDLQPHEANQLASPLTCTNANQYSSLPNDCNMPLHHAEQRSPPQDIPGFIPHFTQNLALDIRSMTPGTQNVTPVTQNMTPASQNMTPATQNMTLAKQNTTPGKQNMTHGNQMYVSTNNEVYRLRVNPGSPVQNDTGCGQNSTRIERKNRSDNHYLKTVQRLSELCPAPTSADSDGRFVPYSERTMSSRPTFSPIPLEKYPSGDATEKINYQLTTADSGSMLEYPYYGQSVSPLQGTYHSDHDVFKYYFPDSSYSRRLYQHPRRNNSTAVHKYRMANQGNYMVDHSGKRMLEKLNSGATEGYHTCQTSTESLVFISCSHCTFRTTDAQELAVHIGAEHVAGMLKCDECDYQTLFRENLTNHKRAYHRCASTAR